jgi:SAM-dependent methyltransferase
MTYNWLAYKLNDAQVAKRVASMTGCVYDLGCGERPYEKDILQHASSYVGVDWSNTLHDLRADIVADLNKDLPIESEVADNVVSFQVLEHLSEPRKMLCEAFRILRPGGGLFLAVPFQWHVHEEPWDFFRYTRFGLLKLLGEAGFAQIEIEAFTGFWTTWVLKFNYHTTRFTRGAWGRVTRRLFAPIWYADQVAAPVMDRLFPAEGETAWYFVTARKPRA